jgi:peptidoglycan/LPS O-acetylase OafA/YrhL
MKDENQLFLKNFRRGMISIFSLLVIIPALQLILSEPTDTTGYLFILSGIFLQTFLSGIILYWYLLRNKTSEIKNIYITSIVIGLLVFLISNGIFSFIKELI